MLGYLECGANGYETRQSDVGHVPLLNIHSWGNYPNLFPCPNFEDARRCILYEYRVALCRVYGCTILWFGSGCKQGRNLADRARAKETQWMVEGARVT